jgi:CheY-like chemotaxis protein
VDTANVIRVFLVEDHELFASGVRSELGDGFEVVGHAGTVEEAVEGVLSSEPDVVLLDMHLPDALSYRKPIGRPKIGSTSGSVEGRRAASTRRHREKSRPSTCGFGRGPPGSRTRNLRIKSLLERRRSGRWMSSEQRV